MQSTQINFRIPIKLKQQAQKKAKNLDMNLSGVVKLFLEKFTYEDVFETQTQHNIKWEKVFDQGVKGYFMSEKGKKNARIIDELLSDVR
ncbi:hypothetical protein KAI52_01140 [Candidatus Parcubacteria bacterium]|nr:hypothetical protein [Candidatus Parcubacteria bacterium]